jgi:hypothetical protein
MKSEKPDLKRSECSSRSAGGVPPERCASVKAAYALALLAGISATALALRFPRAENAHSGPGSFPLFLGAGMAMLSVCGMIQTLRKMSRLDRSLALPESEPSNAVNGRANLLVSRQVNMLLLAGATALYLLLMPLLGFISATALFGMGVLTLLGYRNPARALAAGFIAAFTLYALFGVLMNVLLPKGWIG